MFNAQALHFWEDQPPSNQLLVAAAVFDNTLLRTPEGWKLSRVNPNVVFAHDPGGGGPRMFPQPPGG